MELFVPGRVCLFGEHSDWAGGHRRDNQSLEMGHTLVCGTSQGIYATVCRHEASLLLHAAIPGCGRLGPYELSLEPEALLNAAREGGFWSYVAGVAYQVLTRYGVSGLVIDNHASDLPVKKGLSSSAAICVLTARAFNLVYGLGLSTRDEMELAYLGEITTPSRCGRMDQACAFGGGPVLMQFDGDEVTIAELRPGGPIYLVLADLKAQKNTSKILEQLNRCYPVASDEVQRGVHRLLGPINRRIALRAVDALEAGDARQLGALMSEAQAFFDRYAAPACPEELTAPALHRVLGYEPLRPHVWGGKGVGSQGDGAAQFVARSRADQEAAVGIIEHSLGMSCLTLTLGVGAAPA